MDQQKNHEQIRRNNAETRNEGVGSANQRFFQDPSSNVNTNLRPPDYNMSVGARPVLNFSIQTGEEFALEFMRERVNPRQQFIPNPYSEPHNPSGYSEFKGMLGISHTGSESGSEIAMLNSVEKGCIQDFQRKGSSTHEEKSYYDSLQSGSRTSARNDMSQGFHVYTSSGASDSLPTKVKFLCSFGGKILPRPSDGKLRYVGGETRIIQIRKDISWQDLVQKMLTIYNQTNSIKYQLPGEDLDALVSVSCDEDLQNMMEECNVLQDGGSQKPRMFLFSTGDLEDAQFGLGNTEGDSEIQYVVAVNGMDLGSRKSSIAVTGASENNLDELLNLKVDRDGGGAAPDLAAASTASLRVNTPSSTSQSAQPLPPSSSSPYESNPLTYQGQRLHHVEAGQHSSSRFQPSEGFHKKDEKATVPYGYGSDHSSYAGGENFVSTPAHSHLTQQGGLTEQLHSGFHAQDSEASMKELKLKRDSSAQKLNEPEKIQLLEKEASLKEAKMKRESSLQKISDPDKDQRMDHEYAVSSHPQIPTYIGREEVLITSSAVDTGSSLMSVKSNKKLQEPIQNKMPPEGVNDRSKNSEDDLFYASGGQFGLGYGGLETYPTEFRYLEAPLVPPPVFHSERIPREQAELNRLSKSDDSFGSQFLINQARSDHSQTVTESVDKLHDGHEALQSAQSNPYSQPLYINTQTVEDELEKLKKYKEFADSLSNINSSISEEGLESNLQKPELRSKAINPVDEHEMSWIREDNKAPSMNDKDTADLNNLMAGEGTSDIYTEGSALRPPEVEWSEVSASKKNENNSMAPAEPLTWTENSAEGVPRGESAVVGTPDILIDINDRFPPDLLSDMFSKARSSQNLSQMSPLHEGTGLSMNMENHEPKHWSYFRKLAQGEFVRKDVSLMDQDHLGFSSPLTNEEGAPMDYSYPPMKSDGVSLGQNKSHINLDEEFPQVSSVVIGPHTVNLHPDYTPELKGNESVQLDGVGRRIPESDYEDSKLDIQNTGAPLVDLSLGDFDISTLQIIKNEDLEELWELGSGTFGTVYHGKWRGTDVAIKRIKKSCFTGRSSEQERLTVEFWREAEILSKLHHPNVVAFYGVVQDGPGGTLATVTEYMVNGSLRHVLLSKDRHLDRRKRLIIAMDAAFGMEYLHSKNIVHFDLKCDNLLVNLKDPLRPICKVGDFGLSKIKRNTLVTGGVRGTLPWMAPELLNGSSSKVSEKVDVFSFGIVLWEILTGGIVNNTLRPPVPSFCDSEWRLLMEQCWAPDPVVRPSFTEIAGRLRVMSTACQTKPQGHQPQSQVPK
ncbi:Serine/threonine-protein kinase EDR1 [Morella rubra]|uniref:Serine/threonine-protein kinase EDR1 n=1 Tax=Morella rubra TaxID=262757 RepID=A0A6A1WT09_9ROSI|nr:Serine/threonine-protein kinase EDR1 [Morella rubra]